MNEQEIREEFYALSKTYSWFKEPACKTESGRDLHYYTEGRLKGIEVNEEKITVALKALGEIDNILWSKVGIGSHNVGIVKTFLEASLESLKSEGV